MFSSHSSYPIVKGSISNKFICSRWSPRKKTEPSHQSFERRLARLIASCTVLTKENSRNHNTNHQKSFASLSHTQNIMKLLFYIVTMLSVASAWVRITYLTSRCSSASSPCCSPLLTQHVDSDATERNNRISQCERHCRISTVLRQLYSRERANYTGDDR